MLFLLYSRTFPVIAQAEVKTILKSSGERYKNIRERGDSLVGTGADARTSVMHCLNQHKLKYLLRDNSEKVSSLLGSIGTFDARRKQLTI